MKTRVRSHTLKERGKGKSMIMTSRYYTTRVTSILTLYYTCLMNKVLRYG